MAQSTNGNEHTHNTPMAFLKTLSPTEPISINDAYSLFQAFPEHPVPSSHLEGLLHDLDKPLENPHKLQTFANSLERVCDVSFPNGVVDSDGKFTPEGTMLVTALHNIKPDRPHGTHNYDELIDINRRRLHSAFRKFHTALSEDCEPYELTFARIEIFTLTWGLALLLPVTS